METAKEPAEPVAQKKRGQSAIRFPVYNLADSVVVAKMIQDKGGGVATPEQLAFFLGYKSTHNGAYLGRIGAAKLFGLVSGSGAQLTITPLAQKILMPVYAEQVQEGLSEAFLSPPLFKAIYEECRGKELPPEFGLKNLLRNKFQVTPTRVADAFRTLNESAEFSKFLASRGGRTFLIMPTVTRPEVERGTETEPETRTSSLEHGGGSSGGSGGERGNGSQPTAMDDLRREYVALLMDLFREKAKAGETDPDLMERIEKLLALNA
jgi:hypothetical protein